MKLERFKHVVSKMSLQLEGEIIQRRADNHVDLDLHLASLELSILQRHVVTESVGLKGANFFTMTYSLAGTASAKI